MCPICKRVIVKEDDSYTLYCISCNKKKIQTGKGKPKITVVNDLTIRNSNNFDGMEAVFRTHNDEISTFIKDNTLKYRSIKMTITISIVFLKRGMEILYIQQVTLFLIQ